MNTAPNQQLYQALRQELMEASRLKPTYVHSECSDAQEIRQKESRFRVLDDLFAAKPGAVQTIAAILDPENGQYLVYSGNIEYAYAAQHNYRLNVVVITNQQELDAYNAKKKCISVLGITDFAELLAELRIAAKYPAVERDMPKKDFERLKAKQRAWDQKKAILQANETARSLGWDDDE